MINALDSCFDLSDDKMGSLPIARPVKITKAISLGNYCHDENVILHVKYLAKFLFQALLIVVLRKLKELQCDINKGAS